MLHKEERVCVWVCPVGEEGRGIDYVVNLQGFIMAFLCIAQTFSRRLALSGKLINDIIGNKCVWVFEHEV